MNKAILITFLVGTTLCLQSFGPGISGCKVSNSAFKPGEKATYVAYYQLGPVWVDAGEVEFETTLEKFGNKPCYHFKGTGKTFPSYDNFFKVRDRFEAWVDTATLKPFRYVRDTDDGGFKNYNDNYFNYKTGWVKTYRKLNNDPSKKDSSSILDCTFDVLSMIYASRNVDFASMKVNDSIPISLFLDDKAYNLSVKYLGKTILKTEHGKFRCILFSPRLVAGTIFSEGQRMKVWMTDDANKVPMLVESPVVVGKVKGRIKNWSGLRNPMSSKVE